MPKNRCIHLGLETDQVTVMGYPTILNHCHHARKPEPVDLSHQATYCMTAAHRNCPVFMRSFAAPLPPEISALPKSPVRRNLAIWGLMTTLVAAISLFLFFGGWEWARANIWFAEPAFTNTPSFILNPSTTPLSPQASPTSTRTPLPATPTLEEPTAVITSTITETQTPNPIATATPRPPATQPPTACSHPSGWIVYIVRSGDTLASIGAAYNVSVAQLQAANCMGSSTKIFTGQSLWVPNVPTVTTQPFNPTPTNTPTTTNTPVPSNTPIPTDTPLPTNTLVPTITPSPANPPIEL
jgi:LysM repeat protein